MTLTEFQWIHRFSEGKIQWIIRFTRFSRFSKIQSMWIEDSVDSVDSVRLDTPCTAGARRRWDYANLPLTTTPNLLDSSTFLSTDAIHVRNMFFQEFKKGAQKLVHTSRAFTVDMYTMPTFFQLLKNPVFKTTLLSGTWLPPYIRFAKSNYFPNERTNEQTDGTSDFDLPSDVKSASRIDT